MGNVILAIWTTFWPNISMIYAMWWMMCPISACIVLRVMIYLNRCYNKKFNPMAITKLPFILLVVMMAYGAGIVYNRIDINDIQGTLTNHAIWLEGLQSAVDNLYLTVGNLERSVHAMDEKFTTWSKDLDVKYTEMLNEKESVQRVEELASRMWEGFGLITITRQHFGLGCFVNGTLIQLDAIGNVKKIEDLNEFDMIYNPDLNVTMKMKVLTMGPEEDGAIYQFITNDGFTVSVTKTHPMKICNANNYECENVAASDVYRGDITQTINGYQEIIKINKIPANNVTVYNLMLDLERNIPITQRTIVANNIYTLDLYAQAMNE